MRTISIIKSKFWVICGNTAQFLRFSLSSQIHNYSLPKNYYNHKNEKERRRKKEASTQKLGILN